MFSGGHGEMTSTQWAGPFRVFIPARMAAKRGGWYVIKSSLEEGRRFSLPVAAQEKPDLGAKAGTKRRHQDVTVWGGDLQVHRPPGGQHLGEFEVQQVLAWR